MMLELKDCWLWYPIGSIDGDKPRANENNRRATALVRSLRESTRESGTPPWREIAKELNRGGFKTSRGGTFKAIQAQRLYAGGTRK
ncbi:hypothetical protein [Sabulibacter ruber]|uniref:hypothetical protein n=1 Tax=Sabulibacter ruber TaxID=2811901 RepID=UPI001A963792|nr:hypothetical protein [Sabulibacter ruber]